MGCGSSGSGGCSSGGCSSGACNKMNVFDWLEDMSNPLDFDVIEVKFKGGQKGFFRNVNNLNLHTGDPVVVETSPGHHLGFVSLQGELVRLQMKRKKVIYNDDLKVIYRIAGTRDIEKYESTKKRELPTMFRSRELIQEMKLGMKLSDVEYQADNTKATFFYSAEDRVDFRELIKVLAGEFRIRVEMRQISLRQEAGRLGGIGSCGRELCCSTWLSDFKSVSTSAARYQNLSLNPSKLSGQCGRLKCCLNYELETYLSELKEIPEVKGVLKTKQGNAKLVKTDIFKRLMWFSLDNDVNWVALKTDRVREIQQLNSKGDVPFSLLVDQVEVIRIQDKNSDLLKLDRKLKEKSKAKTSSKKPRKFKPKKDNGPSDQPKSKKNTTNKPNKNRNQNNKKKQVGEAKPKVEGAVSQKPRRPKKKFTGKPKPQSNSNKSE